MVTVVSPPRIWIIAPFIALPDEPQANRFWDLATRFSCWAQTKLVSSRFHHFSKRHRTTNPETVFDLVLLDEPGYSGNISLKRLRSHTQWLRNLDAWLDQQDPPDLIYAAIPFLKTADLIKKRWPKTLLILDIQDRWPEAMIARARLPLVILQPLADRQTKGRFEHADALISVSQTYLPALDKPSLVAPLGSHRPDLMPRPAQPFRLVFAGTLGANQALKPVLTALSNTLRSEIELWIIGDGPAAASLKRWAAKTKAPVRFLGALSHPETLSALQSCDLAINAIQPSANLSLTSKIADYLACGLPVLNSQPSPELRLCLGQAGLHYQTNSAIEFLGMVSQVRADPQKLKQMGLAASKQFDLWFDRDTNHRKIETFVKAQMEVKCVSGY